MILEVCCNGYEDSLIAYKNGANRIELNTAIFLGGLTANVLHLKQLKQVIPIPIICMVRERGSGFNYNDFEHQQMLFQAKHLLENGADGIAFGYLNSDSSINVAYTKEMVNLIHDYNREAVFHRAFDVSDDLFSSLEKLINCRVDRVLTSGGCTSAVIGKENIAKLINLANNRIEILAGCGINSENVIQLLQIPNLKQIHASCKTNKFDNTGSNNIISYEYQVNGGYECVLDSNVRNLKLKIGE